MSDAFNLPDISSYAAPIYMVFIIGEILLVHGGRLKGDYEARDAATSITMGLGSLIVPLLLSTTIYAALYGFLFWVYQYRLITLPFSPWVLLVVFVLDDFRYYWSHRLQHIIRWGWANHVIHHSSQHFNFSTALRQPWASFLTGSFLLAVPLVLFGVHPAWLAFVYSINLFYQFFIHTETVDKLPRWIEAIFNTPSHHRVHHGRNPRYLDSNYAGVLIIWDKMFGTFVPEDSQEPVRYGIVKNIGTFNPFKVATHEYWAIIKDASRRGLSLGQRLAYIFAPPGWTHEGAHSTSREIKRRYVEEHPQRAGTPGLPASTARTTQAHTAE